MKSRRALALALAAAAVGLLGAGAASKAGAGRPALDLGPNVLVFSPSMPAAEIQERVDAVFRRQERSQFGAERYALLFLPGSYDVDVNVGYYTQVLGLGAHPDDVTVRGAVHVEADWFGGNATHNFWRGAENLSVVPTSGTDRWAVSQAAPYRRMHVRGSLRLDDGGWSSGGFFADSRIDGQVLSGSQQQWLSRNTEWGGWTGSNWNMVFVGATNPPPGTFPDPPYTVVERTPVVREKPFLHVDRRGRYRVFVPALRKGSTGTTWGRGAAAGSSLPIERFFVARPGTSAATLNAALARGRHLLLLPGIYHLDEPLAVTRPNTVVLGLGLATLVPERGAMAMAIDDVDGVKVAGLLVDAGPVESPLLVQVGPPGSRRDHAANPTSLHDVFVRIGGAGVGKAVTSVAIHSDDVIGDHLWLWRGDHGDGIGWTSNTAATGLVVEGDDVTMYGLFVEHYQRHQVLWSGNRGRTYFFQNEMPYDPPSQADWMDGERRGYAAYRVAPTVTVHEAHGLGSYCYFRADPGVVADRAFEAPDAPGVKFRSLVTVSLGGVGTIRRVINETGGPSSPASHVANVVAHPGH